MARRRREPDPSYYRGSRAAWSPAMLSTVSGVDADIDREIDEIRQALERQGPMGKKQLRRELSAGIWGPGRLSKALAVARRRGVIEREGRRYSVSTESA